MVLRCDCGYETSGECEADLVAAAQAHSTEAHATDLGADVIRALLRSRARPRESGDGAAP